jgi:hypothetical protein
LIRAHSNQNISDRKGENRIWSRLTLIEELFQSNSFPVNIGSWRIVGLRVVDHKSEISLEAGPIFVKAVAELRTYGTQVYRILDDLEVTKCILVKVGPQIGDP